MPVLGVLFGLGLAANLGLAGLCLWVARRDARRERRRRAVVRALNSRRWVFAQERRVCGGNGVPSEERWPA